MTPPSPAPVPRTELTGCSCETRGLTSFRNFYTSSYVRICRLGVRKAIQGVRRVAEFLRRIRSRQRYAGTPRIRRGLSYVCSEELPGVQHHLSTMWLRLVGGAYDRRRTSAQNSRPGGRLARHCRLERPTQPPLSGSDASCGYRGGTYVAHTCTSRRRCGALGGSEASRICR